MISSMLRQTAPSTRFKSLSGCFDLEHWKHQVDDLRVRSIVLPVDFVPSTNISFFLGVTDESYLQALFEQRRRAWDIDPAANYYTLSARVRINRNAMVFSETATLLALSSNPVIFETHRLSQTASMRLLSNTPTTPFSRRTISNACVTANLSTIDATIHNGQWKTVPLKIPDEIYFWKECNNQNLVVNMDRQLRKQGYHRTLVTRGTIHQNERYKNLLPYTSKCRVVVVEHLSNSVYVDQFEVCVCVCVCVCVVQDHCSLHTLVWRYNSRESNVNGLVNRQGR
jgi:hypothetical protein